MEEYEEEIWKLAAEFPFDTFDYPPEVESAPYKFAISARNRYMAKNTDFVIAYINREYGGAYDAVNIAQNNKKNVLFIN